VYTLKRVKVALITDRGMGNLVWNLFVDAAKALHAADKKCGLSCSTRLSIARRTAWRIF